MDKAVINSFDYLYNNALFPAFLTDDQLNIIKTNKYIKLHYSYMLEDRQLTKYFVTPNRHMAIVSLRETSSLQATFKDSKNNLFIATVNKIGGYGNICIITLTPYISKLSKDSTDTTALLAMLRKIQNTMQSAMSSTMKIHRRFSDNFDSDDKENIISLVRNIHSILLTASNVSIFKEITEGQIENDSRRINLSLFINKLFQEFYDFLKLKNLDFVFSINSFDIISYFDPDLLIQAIDNLITNASEHCKPGTKIRGKVFEKNGTLCISIQNKGELLPRSLTSKFFQPYYSYNSLNSNENRVGMGLTTARLIAQLYNGDCKFSSTAKYGNVAMLTIPIVDTISDNNTLSEDVDIISFKNINLLENYYKKTLKKIL